MGAHTVEDPGITTLIPRALLGSVRCVGRGVVLTKALNGIGLDGGSGEP